MVPVERIWRIKASAMGPLEVRLSPGSGGEEWTVALVGAGLADGDEQTFEVEAAQAVAQALLEACEVAAALGGTVR
jgi:hypothetical protein